MNNNITLKDFIKQAASVIPSRRQTEWFDIEFYAFVHFSPNTYTDLEWGMGNEDPAIFNPTDLDCDSWVDAVKSAGMRGIIITAKHHDGFCLWQTETTMHSVKSSPWKNGRGDVVRELADACRRGGIKFGFYLSPWDRNSKLYGTAEYNDFYRAQLTELLTGYGDVFEVWFDGACGEGPNGRRQEYDFDSYIDLIRKYQPNACIFNDHGPDIRWCGNEGGHARHAEWSVVPRELCYRRTEAQTSAGPLKGDLSYLYNSLDEIGSLHTILYTEGLVFAGSEIDMSIRPGWFYHAAEEPHSLDRLFKTYITSVGGNANFLLNIPPMPNGLFDPRDISRLKELGDAIRESFGNPVTGSAKIEKAETPGSDTQCIYNINFNEPHDIRYVSLSEDITLGQRVSGFLIQRKNWDGWDTVYEGTTVGHKKICPVNLKAIRECRVYITSARDTVNLKHIELY
ncbi:MAG: alpha-L-fucosidase [Eubacteriales bacterium]|jgi:alpha-L-fucosidase|nr:alpha-L-fucosidase [Eubacteriales bacterium]